jgi:hypothetical protein
MTLEQLNLANQYMDGIKKAERIKKVISSFIYNAEKGDGINMNILFENINIEDDKRFKDIMTTCQMSHTDDEVYESFFLETKEPTPTTTIDIDLLRYMMAAMDKSIEHFKKKIEEI